MWIELHQSLFTHRKTMLAADALDVPEVHVVGHLAALWTWGLDNAPDGTIEASPRIIARACQWAGDAKVLVAGLVSAGFLIQIAEGQYRIHDWHDYAGRLMEQRQRNADRQKRFRDKNRDGGVTEQDSNIGGDSQSSLHNAHVTVTNASRNPATGQDSTGPNLTVPDLDTVAQPVAVDSVPDGTPQGDVPKEIERIPQIENAGDLICLYLKLYTDRYGAAPTSLNKAQFGASFKRLCEIDSAEDVGQRIRDYFDPNHRNAAAYAKRAHGAMLFFSVYDEMKQIALGNIPESVVARPFPSRPLKPPRQTAQDVRAHQDAVMQRIFTQGDGF